MSEFPALDRIDFELVRALQNDARTSNKELAARVGLAPSSCLTRVRHLRERGVVRGFHTDVEPGAVGVGIEALTMVRLSPHKRGVFRAFREHAMALPEVVVVYQLSGQDDFVIHAAVRDTDHLQAFTDRLTEFPRIASLSTAIIFEASRRPLPLYQRQ